MATTNLEYTKEFEKAFMCYCEEFPDRLFNSPFIQAPYIDSSKWTGRRSKSSWDKGFVSFRNPWFSISIGRFMGYADRHIRIAFTFDKRVYHSKETFYFTMYGKHSPSYFEFILWKDKMSKLMDFKVRIIHQTPLAYLFTQDDEKEIWIPKSRCEFYTDDKSSDTGTLTMTERQAIESELV